MVIFHSHVENNVVFLFFAGDIKGSLTNYILYED